MIVCLLFVFTSLIEYAVVNVLARRTTRPSKHVDDGVLDQRREDEQQTDDHRRPTTRRRRRTPLARLSARWTDDHPDVDRLDVGDARQRRARAAAHRRSRQHGQPTDRLVTHTGQFQRSLSRPWSSFSCTRRQTRSGYSRPAFRRGRCVGDHSGRRRSVLVWSVSAVSQHGQQADGDARRTRVDVEPERDPRQDDDQHAGNVELNDEVADVSHEHEPNLETRECTCRQDSQHRLQY